eukprot:748183-Pelagomonas_calceolata.AAC.1
MGHSLLTAGRRNGQPVAEVDSERFAEPSRGEIHNTTLEHITKMWHGTFQFNWVRAAMHFYNSLSKCNSLLLKKVSKQTSALAPELTLVGHHTS